jgi:hypothetical protein
MSKPVAGSTSPRTRHISLIPTPFGLYAVIVEIDPPWMPASALAQILDRAKSGENPPVGQNETVESVGRPAGP